MVDSIVEAKDTAIAIKYLIEAKTLLRKDNESFQDIEQLLLKASKFTHFETYLELAKLYEKHNFFDKALKWYMYKYDRSLLDNKDLIKVASWYEQGIGTKIDKNMAVELYTRIAFIDDEALAGVIRLYKNKGVTYMRVLAPGLMTPEKWRHEADKRGVKY
jgi:TPR repeat protein